MVTTTWIAGSGDWNTASNWSNGVPTAADDAVFSDPPRPGGNYTVTGGGVAASLTIMPDPVAYEPSFAGAISVGTFTDNGVYAHLLGTAALSFGTGTITGGAQFEVQAGATLGTGTLTLSNGTLTGTLGALANPIALVASGAVSATGTLTGRIAGTGALHVSGGVVLSNPGNTYSGGTAVGPASVIDIAGAGRPNHLELAVTGAAGTGPLSLSAGTLVLDRGVRVDAITSAFAGHAEIDATDQTTTVFSEQLGLAYNNGAGHALIVGSILPGPQFTGEGPDIFGAMTVQGGSGSVTVFGGTSSCLLYGGTAGGNVLIGGADLSLYGPATKGGGFVGAPHLLAYTPGPSTLFAGGDNDLLVASGTDNSFVQSPVHANILVAAGGRETLTGAGSTGHVLFFGGTGADVIAAGGGASTIVAGSGASTISGGSAATAIFAGAGTAVVLGGAGADYVQAGAGNATLFAGAGMDLIGVVDGQAGGSLVVSGFRTGTDRISAQGYAAGPTVASAGGSTVLTFSDQTRVTLLGVASVAGGVFG